MSREHMVRIEKGTLTEGAVSITPALAGSLGLREGQPVTVSFGLKSTRAILYVSGASGKKNRLVRLASDVVRAIHIPTGLSLHIKAIPGGFKLGPTLGIFAPKFGVGRFGAHTPYIRSLVRYSRRMGLWAYVFTSADVNLEDRTTKGYYLSGGHWVSMTLPLPDVCYDRIPSRRIEAQSRIKEVKEALRSMNGIICFNNRFMDKWRVHRELSGNQTADAYLPKTKIYEGEEDLRSFFAKYRKVFLKPCGGSQGNGIIKIVREGSDTFSYVATARGRGTIRGFDSLTSKVRRLVGERRYIIQQGLNLATVAGRHFDIRLLMQKDSTGKWFFTKAYARVAAPGHITSNISRGAEGTGMGKVLARAFGSKGRGISKKVKVAGRQLAPEVERELNQHFGELGLDLGVDTSGKVWLIEVNSKPFRHMTTETGSQLEIIRSVIRPLSYSLGISGFHKMKVRPLVTNDGEEQEVDLPDDFEA